MRSMDEKTIINVDRKQLYGQMCIKATTPEKS